MSGGLLVSHSSFLLAFALCAASSVLLRARADRLRSAPAQIEFDLPAFPAEVARPFSFGLRSLVADLAFLEAIQVYGGQRGSRTAAEGAAVDRAMNRLLTYSTDLDPKFAGAYRFAGNAMPRHTTDGKVTNVLQAEMILKKGAVERGDDWRIPFSLGFIQFFYLGHFEEAARNLATAARMRGAPAYLGLLATRMAAEAGDLDYAEQMARVMADQASGETSSQEEWRQRLLDLRMERELRAIEAAAQRYKQRTGRFPSSLAALVRAGDLPSLPVEPRGGRYELDENGEARSTAARRLRIRRRDGVLAGLEVR